MYSYNVPVGFKEIFITKTHIKKYNSRSYPKTLEVVKYGLFKCCYKQTCC